MMDQAANILHADLDAFYASVEQLLNPALRDKPIAVGGGVVLAASYEAKKFGVHGGMSGRKARELCPQLLFVRGSFGEYQRLGDAAVAILSDFTPLVERISIDEAFADVAGCTHLFGSPQEIAATIRRRVRDELGLPISVGVARTKHLAKIASQVAKPDGLVVVDPATELEFLHDLPVGLMWGVGPVTKAKLTELGILTIGQLANTPGRSLERLLGPAAGEKLSALAWNRDPREIRTHHRARSAGAQSALGRKPAVERVIKPTLLHLADRVATRLRAKSLAGSTVTARVRFADLRAVTRSMTLDVPISATVMLAEIGEELVRAALADHPERQSHILPGGQMLEQAEVLKHDADPPPERGAFARRDAAHVLAEELDLPPRRMERHEKEAEQRRLSGARGAGEKVERPGPKMKVDVGQDFGPSIVLKTDVRQPYHGACAPGGSIAR